MMSTHIQWTSLRAGMVSALFMMLCLGSSRVAVAQPVKPTDIKTNVVVVRPTYHDQTKRTFADLSRAFSTLADRVDATGEPQLAGQAQMLRQVAARYASHATSPGHGSGWFWMPPGSPDVAYLVTNKHVAGQAAHVAIEWDGDRFRSLHRLPVVYVSSKHDLAVIEVPRRKLPAEVAGFEIGSEEIVEGMDVFASGFPGSDTSAGNVAAYSLTDGIISNNNYAGLQGRALSHTAAIDPGNSGGPLLLKSADGFRLAGMNTWKLNRRTNTNLSIPASTIDSELRKAMRSRTITRNKRMLREDLRKSADQLAIELGSTSRNAELLREMISYRFVSDASGTLFDAYSTMLYEDIMRGELRDQTVWFLNDPVESSRTLLWAFLVDDYGADASNIGSVKLLRLVDQDQIGQDSLVRSYYEVRGKTREVVWVWEHGAWRIASATLAVRSQGQATGGGNTQVTPAPQRPEREDSASAGGDQEVSGTTRAGQGSERTGNSAQRGVSWFGFEYGRGEAGVLGEDTLGAFPIDVTRMVALNIGVPLSRRIGFITGVGYAQMGTGLTVVDEDLAFTTQLFVNYVRVPGMLQLELPLETDVISLRGFGRAGLALDARVGFRDEADFFSDEGFSDVALARLWAVGGEIGFGRDPLWWLGMGYYNERHVLSDVDELDFRLSGGRVLFSVRYGRQARRE